MEFNQLKSQVRHLISQARTEAALKTITTWAYQYNKEDLKNDAAQLSSQLYKLNRQINMGLISYGESSIQSSKITNRVLNLLSGIDDVGILNIQKSISTPIYTGNKVSTARKTLKIFLASSNQLKTDRDAFELHFGARKRKTFQHDIEVVLWEDFIDAMSKTRLQDEYNKAVQDCDIFVMLFFTKVGKYTEEEFETAFGHFKANGKPIIYTYFKNADIKTGDISEDDLLSLLTFKKKLRKLEHFVTEYSSPTDLNFQFSNQLDKLLKTNRI